MLPIYYVFLLTHLMSSQPGHRAFRIVLYVNPRYSISTFCYGIYSFVDVRHRFRIIRYKLAKRLLHILARWLKLARLGVRLGVRLKSTC